MPLPKPPGEPPIHQPAPTLAEAIARQPNNGYVDLLQVLARGVEDGHDWSIKVSAYFCQRSTLTEAHKAVLRDRRGAYVRRDARAATSNLQAAPPDQQPTSRPAPITTEDDDIELP